MTTHLLSHNSCGSSCDLVTVSHPHGYLYRQSACCIASPEPPIKESPPPDEPIPSTPELFQSTTVMMCRLTSIKKKKQTINTNGGFISRQLSRDSRKSKDNVRVRPDSMDASPSATLRTPLLDPTRKYSSVDNGYLSMQTSRTYFQHIDRYLPYDCARKSLKKRKDTVLGSSVDYEKYGNGGVRFDPTLELGGEPKIRSNSTVRVIRRRQSGYGISITSESTAKMRCRMRKQLFIRRNKVCDLSLLLAIAGLIFVVVDSELTALQSDTGVDKGHWISLLLRSACVFTTVCLMACLCNYHSIEVKIALIDSGADDWRVALSTDRMIKLSLELLVCSICPFPGTGSIAWPFISPETRKVKMIPVPVDVLLSVPMFLRSYLLCRFMVLHSKQFQDAATRSIAALNRISMDFRFVIKTMMSEHPLRVLIVFTVTYWICMSWMFTQCERYDGQLDTEHYYLNSMWFIMVTFMSIGYGDIVPNTYCGRTLSITTGIVGAGVSSALIAVISRKLELSRAEKHVNNFMADSKLTNQRKNAAASVLQETWFIHKFKKSLNKGDDLRLRHHQRRFLHSINEFRRIKWDQRKLQEKGNSLLDVGKLHSDMHETLWEMHRTQDHFIAQVDLLTQKIVELQNTLIAQNVRCGVDVNNESAQSTPQPNMMMQPSFSLSRLSVPNGQISQIPQSVSSGISSSPLAPPPSSVHTVSTPHYNGVPQSTSYGTNPLACPGNGVYATVTTPLMNSVDNE